MENLFTPIGTLAKQSLPVIANHAPQAGLFAGSIELNAKEEKYNLVSTPGEATPIAYESKTMAAFVRHLYTVAAIGKDFDYQPTMRVSEALTGCKVLVFSDNELILPDEATRLPLPTGMSAQETANVIGAQVREYGGQIVIIDDATTLLDNNPCEAIALLNYIANVQGFMLLYGIDVAKATDTTLDYIARHAHNLCQLVQGSIEIADEAETKTVDYFCFTYGRPTPHRIIYSVSKESGTVTIPKTPATDIVRMQECGEMFAEKGISQTAFADRVYGYYKGAFQKSSIKNMIGDAVKNGTLQRSGSGKHTTLCLLNTPQQRKVYKGTIAIKARLNRYCKETAYSHAFEPVAYMGDFKLLAADGKGSALAAQWLIIGLIKAVISDEKQLEFKIATSHRNTLIICVGTDETANRVKASIGEPKGATLDVICTNGTITDSNFLSLYRTATNQHKPDFCFIIHCDAIKQEAYTPSQLIKELAMTSKKGGFVTIAHMSKWDGEPMPTGDEFWHVKPLVSDDIREDFEKFANNNYLQHLYEFEANSGRLQFLTRFKIERGAKLATPKEQQEAFYKATFFWCDHTPREHINEDCTGKPLNNSVLYQAEQAGIIHIDYPGKKAYKDCIVTYIDK